MASKDEVMAATPEQLNEWAALHVMGWKKLHDVDRPQFITWVSQDRTTVQRGLCYSPTTDIAQAMSLLMHLQATRKWSWSVKAAELRLNPRTEYSCTIVKHSVVDYMINTSLEPPITVMEDSLPLTITRAALLAIAAKKEQHP